MRFLALAAFDLPNMSSKSLENRQVVAQHLPPVDDEAEAPGHVGRLRRHGHVDPEERVDDEVVPAPVVDVVEGALVRVPEARVDLPPMRRCCERVTFGTPVSHQDEEAHISVIRAASLRRR